MPDTSTRVLVAKTSDGDAAFTSWMESNRFIIIGLAVAVAALWTLLFFSLTVDDAFISFRYGKNLVLNHVWNWNPSGTHEEAYTSALYTILAAISFLLHLPTVIFIKLIGLACLGRMLYRLQTLPGSRFASLLGLLVLALSPVVWAHTFSCLETPLYILLIFEMAIAVSQASETKETRETNKTSPVWIYTLFVLLPLTRPEGFVFACAGVIFFWRLRKENRHFAWFGVAVLVELVYFVLRWHYFQHLLPNPFYVKVVHRTLPLLFREMVTNVAQFKGYFFTVVLIALVARRSITRVFALCSLLLMLLLFAPHEMAMNYADRFYFQLTLPVLLIFLVLEDLPRIARLAATIAALFLFAFSPDDLLNVLKYPADIARAHYDLGRRLAPFAAGHTLIAGDVGGIPFYANWQSYDFAGLGTNTIAQHGLTVPALESMRPDLIILYNAKPGPGLLEDGSWSGDPEPNVRPIIQYIRQSNDYQYAGSAKSHSFYLVEFLRKDTPQHDAILATLQENTLTSTTGISLKGLLLQRYLPSSR